MEWMQFEGCIPAENRNSGPRNDKDFNDVLKVVRDNNLRCEEDCRRDVTRPTSI
jgi:hypothetical protein